MDSRIRWGIVFSVAAGAVACSNDPAEAEPSGGAGSGGGSASSGELVGAFLTELIAATDTAEPRTAVSGKVYDASTPSNIAWEELATSGACVLSKPSAPFCDPGCTGGAVCVADGECKAYPNPQNVGDVQVTGLGDSTFTMKPIVNAYQLPGDVALAYPPAAEGAELTFAVAGGAYGPFTLGGHMVAPLEWSAELALDQDSPVPLEWAAPGDAELARIHVAVDLSHHGGTKGKIECELPDTGSGEIPADLVTQLIELGVAGFPKITLTRSALSSTAIAPGLVKLEVLSAVTHEVVVAGFTSCTADTQEQDCEAGETCQQDGTCG